MGYLHTAPRLLAELAALLPLEWSAAVFAGGSGLVVSALALLVYRASGGYLHHKLARAVVAGSMVLLPVAADEVVNNAANLHWFLIFASFWVLLWRPRRFWELGVGALVLVLSGLSDPQTALLAPIVLLRVIALPGWRDQLFSSAWAVGLALQLVGIVARHAHRQLQHGAGAVTLAGWYVRDVIGGAFFGARLLGAHHSATSLLLAGLGVLALGLLAFAVLHGRRLRARPLAVLAAFMSVVLFLVPVGLTRVDAPRYPAVPVLLLLTAVATLLDDSSPGLPVPACRAARIAALTLVAVVWLIDFRISDARSQGPTWNMQLQAAEANCAGRTGIVIINISPRGWQADVDCHHLPAPPR
jgi:hypothetical protein